MRTCVAKSREEFIVNRGKCHAWLSLGKQALGLGRLAGETTLTCEPVSYFRKYENYEN